MDIPNLFGIERHREADLLACLFPTLLNLSEYNFEIILPEYIDGAYFTSNGSLQSSSNYAYAVVDISKYESVLVPCSTRGAGDFSGIRSTADDTGPFSRKGYITGVTADGYLHSAYMLFERESTCLYAIMSVDISTKYMPVIGFRRHRSDHVNPLGVIQPLDPGALEPLDPEPDPEDQEER